MPSVLGDRRKPDDPMQWDFMLRQDEQDRLHPHDQLQRDDGRGGTQGRRRGTGEAKACAAWSSTCATIRAACCKSAVEICDLFLEKGAIVSTKGRNHKEETYEAKPEGTLLLPADKHPMAVLVNKLQRQRQRDRQRLPAGPQPGHHRRRTQLRQGQRAEHHHAWSSATSALKLTTASYWRPSGKNIHRFPDSKDFEAADIDPDEWGVKPDEGFEVPLKDEERYDYMIYRSDRDIVRRQKGRHQRAE